MFSYLPLLHAHRTLVALSLGFFLLRGLWMLLDSPRLQQRWVKISPHIIDTALLCAGLALAITVPFNPLHHPWLQAKLLALLGYIGLGMLTFKATNKSARAAAFAGALLCAAYMVLVALSKNPLPW